MKNCLFAVWIASTVFAAETNWRPIPPEILSSKTPKIDPQADAECLFWDSWVEDYTQGGYAQHRTENYIRIKLYNARAIETWGDVKIEYPSSIGATISDFKGRVVKTDGSIVEVKGNQAKDTTVLKAGKLNIRAKSFAFPGLQPGDIIEYKYIENVSGGYFRYVRLPMQMEIPAWEITRNVRPLYYPSFSDRMTSYPFNIDFKGWREVTGVAGRSDFVRTSVQDMPAFVREPQMPDEDDVRGWILIFYVEGERKPEKYWPSLGRKLNDEFRKGVKVNNEIKKIAAEVAGPVNSAVGKAKALAFYCQTQIRNVAFEADGMKAQDRDDFFKTKLKDDDVYTSADALKHKIGRPQDIRLLFFALAEAAGLNPVFAVSSSTDGPLFHAAFTDPYFIKSNVLVGIPETPGGKLNFYNPGSPYLPAGMVNKEYQGQPVLLCDPKEPKLMVGDASPAEMSAANRSAAFSLSADGALKGDVRMVYTGHLGAERKRIYDGKSPEERDKELQKQFELRYPGAQISKLRVENADTPAGDFTVSYHIEMENYAQRTGKRMFLQPGFFQFADKPIFTASKRRFPIQYDNAWSENDRLDFALPPGFVLDAADMPGEIKLGGVGDYKFGGAYNKQAHKLTITRSLKWGQGGTLWFEAKGYPAVKDAWDKLHAADTHQLTLKAEPIQ